MFDLNKKEKPFTSFGGFGGGGLGLAGGGGIKLPTYVDDVFSTFLQDGTTNTPLNVDNGINLAGEGGLIWFKSRHASGTFGQHVLFDTKRDANKGLLLPSTGGESTLNGYPVENSFESDGFTWGSENNFHPTGSNFVSWTFRKAPGFFDVVTYNGDTSNNPQSIPHSLGSVPGFIIVKRTDNTGPWLCYHRSLGNTKNMELQSSNDDDTNATIWNNTDPTSTHFTVGSNANVNGNGRTFVAYIFAHDDAQYGTDEDESIIKCGTYIGGGSTSVEVNLGFEPQWVLIKSADSGYGWQLIDNMRGISPGDDAGISSNSDTAESQMDLLDLTATGFRTGNNANANREDDNFIYIAIRRPNKPPEAAINVFAIDTMTGSIPNYISGFPVDFVIRRDGINSGGDVHVASRLQGRKFLKTNSTEVEGNAFVSAAFDHSNAFASGTGSSPDSESFAWMFKRAPGFMDVVAYPSNNNTTTNISHNLTVKPEIMIIKNRSRAVNWIWYDKINGATNYMQINNANGSFSNSSVFNDTEPTSSVFTVGTSTQVNGPTGEDHVAFLFATLSGISMVGSYNGNTNNVVNVPCGFTAGARFILIKRSDVDFNNDWYFWDSVRGINAVDTNSGLDPYLLLNRDNNGTDAQVTNTNYIDPVATGFKVTGSAPAALNATGGTYIFLAIA